MRNHGLKNRDECEFWGFNSRLDNIQAAIARIKLPYLDQWNKKFNEIAKAYSHELKKIVTVPINDKNKISVYHRYIIQSSKRNELKNYLERNGIETKINYPIPLHLQSAISNLGWKRGDFPIVESLCEKLISLPLYPELSAKKLNLIIDTVNQF